MKIAPIKQRDTNACGPSCIEMTLCFFGIPFTIKEIAKRTNYKNNGGLYNKQIVDTLQSYGLKTKISLNTTWEKLLESNTSDSVIVVSWMLDGYIGHVSVVEKVDQKNIYLAEPTTGKILKIEKIKFLRLWLDYEAKPDVPMFPESKSDIQLRWMVMVNK